MVLVAFLGMDEPTLLIWDFYNKMICTKNLGITKAIVCMAVNGCLASGTKLMGQASRIWCFTLGDTGGCCRGFGILIMVGLISVTALTHVQNSYFLYYKSGFSILS